MMGTVNFNKLLAGSGEVTLKPDTVGETLGGVIVSSESRQMTDFSTNEPLTWNDGKPRMQIVITVDLGTRDMEGNPEHGCVYIKTWGEQKQALMQAIKHSGAKDANSALAPGNRFTITLKGEKPNEKNPRLNATKLYEYQIELRANLGETAQLLTEPQAATTTAPATPAAPAGGGSVDIPALMKAGLPDQQIASITGIDVTAIAAIRTTL